MSVSFFLILSPIPLLGWGDSEQMCGICLPAGLKHNNFKCKVYVVSVGI